MITRPNKSLRGLLQIDCGGRLLENHILDTNLSGISSRKDELLEHHRNLGHFFSYERRGAGQNRAQPVLSQILKGDCGKGHVMAQVDFPWHHRRRRRPKLIWKTGYRFENRIGENHPAVERHDQPEEGSKMHPVPLQGKHGSNTCRPQPNIAAPQLTGIDPPTHAAKLNKRPTLTK